MPPNININQFKNVVFIDGVRTPFCKINTNFNGWKPHRLASIALKGLFERTNFNKKNIDYVCMGNVLQEISTTNIAREILQVAGISNNVCGHTVSMACISANQAIVNCVNMIKLNQANFVIAGGVDFMSDPPIKISEGLRYALVKASQIPSITEYTSNETMGKSADRLASSFGISRKQQDEYALRTHNLAKNALKNGHLNDIIPVMTEKGLIKQDNTICDYTIESLSQMKPVFIKDYGTVTKGNSCAITDGAAVSLLMSEEKAKELEIFPKAYIRPAYAISKLMIRNNLTWKDIGVVELHEPFASQILSVNAALESEYFCINHIGLKTKFGSIPMEILNKWGGSLSLGHPFGATGIRLLTMAANRLINEHSIDPNYPKYAIISGCAAGGLAHAMIIERYP